MNTNAMMHLFGTIIGLSIEDFRRCHEQILNGVTQFSGNADFINYQSAKHYLFSKSGLEYFFDKIPPLGKVLSLDAVRKEALHGLPLRKELENDRNHHPKK